jgi:hypothetical protein
MVSRINRRDQGAQILPDEDPANMARFAEGVGELIEGHGLPLF